MAPSLSIDALRRAETFLAERARPLERATHAWSRGAGSAEAVREALAAFQRAGGGFGGGLEPDLPSDGPSVYATTVALQTLAELGAGADDPLVAGAMRYLAACYDAAQRAWPMVPEDLDSAPHAPWWEPEEDLGPRRINPRAEILAHVLRWPGALPEATVAELLAETLDELDARAGELEQHELLCALRLLRAPGLAEVDRARLSDTLEPVALRLVGRDGAAWAEYGLQPLWVAESPDAPFADRLSEAIAANLDWLVETQGPDGSWSPAWDWSFVDAEAWARARRAWQGLLTLRNLRALGAFERIAERR